MASSAPRYARAFAEVVQANELDAAAAQQQLRDFAETLAGSFELCEFLMNPSVGMPQKLKVLDAMSGRIGMSPKVRNFVAVVMEHHRLGELSEILTEYGEVIDAQAGAAEATITSAHPLNADDKAQLEAEVAKLAGGKVCATYREDATLIGGAVVQIGATVYDGSVRAQLERMKHSLVNA